MQCEAITKSGRRCSIDADPGSTMCHVHRPDATFQRQQRGKGVPGRKRQAQAGLFRNPNGDSCDWAVATALEVTTRNVLLTLRAEAEAIGDGELVGVLTDAANRIADMRGLARE